VRHVIPKNAKINICELAPGVLEATLFQTPTPCAETPIESHLCCSSKEVSERLAGEASPASVLRPHSPH
jgi:hypothetical protein